MLKGLIVIDDNFEEAECLVTRDILKRAGIATQILALNGKDYLTSSTNLVIKSDLSYPFLNYRDYDFLLITGGMWVITFLNSAEKGKKTYLTEMVNYFYSHNKLLGAICAAPVLLFDAGVLPKQYTCFPGCANLIKYPPQDDNVVKEKNIITAKAMGASFDFALEIVKSLQGEQTRDKVANAIYFQS